MVVTPLLLRRISVRAPDAGQIAQHEVGDGAWKL